MSRDELGGVPDETEGHFVRRRCSLVFKSCVCASCVSRSRVFPRPDPAETRDTPPAHQVRFELTALASVRHVQSAQALAAGAQTAANTPRPPTCLDFAARPKHLRLRDQARRKAAMLHRRVRERSCHAPAERILPVLVGRYAVFSKHILNR